MLGKLYGVGVGPGDPELLTIKALKTIEKSEVIILPTKEKEACYSYHIVKEVYPDIDKKELYCMPFPMRKEKEELEKAHAEIYERVKQLLNRGKTVSFLVIGDPSIYSTYAYIHQRVIDDQGNARMISGIPSFCAAAAALGIPLVGNEEELHIIPASYDILDTLSLKGTRVYMKSGKKLLKLKEALMSQQQEQPYEVYTVSNCGMPNQSKPPSRFFVILGICHR